jgi:hypothetical protein
VQPGRRIPLIAISFADHQSPGLLSRSRAAGGGFSRSDKAGDTGAVNAVAGDQVIQPQPQGDTRQASISITTPRASMTTPMPVDLGIRVSFRHTAGLPPDPRRTISRRRAPALNRIAGGAPWVC